MTSEWEALVVGINRYPQMTTLQDLKAAAKDAEDIALYLREYGYQPFRVQRLPQQLDGKGEAQIHSTGLVKLKELQEALIQRFALLRGTITTMGKPISYSSLLCYGVRC